MCVPYGTEATVYGSQIGKHPLDRETFLSKKQETNKKQTCAVWELQAFHNHRRVHRYFERFRKLSALDAKGQPVPATIIPNLQPTALHANDNALRVTV